jgi:TolA-binding protein
MHDPGKGVRSGRDAFRGKVKTAAALRLKVARRLEAEGFPSKARVRYREIVDQYPGTQAAREAAQALQSVTP